MGMSKQRAQPQHHHNTTSNVTGVPKKYQKAIKIKEIQQKTTFLYLRGIISNRTVLFQNDNNLVKQLQFNDSM